ncbi:MAG: hypothetical protein HOP15_02945 [Planctomycetes bacterium]|nr:hypothetical protein [Planctomycetota bacterium]
MSIARTVLVLVPFALAGCSLQGASRPALPRPTENVLDEEAEGRQQTLRKAWFEHRHQAGPGVEWRALERANGEALIERRNQLSRALVTGSNPWVERGSQNVAGRVHTAALAPDGLSLVVGTALGGVWEGSLDGAGWTPFGDNLFGGGHHLALIAGATPADPDVVLVASDGGMVHVTRDQGVTWQIPSGLGASQGVRRTLTASDGSGTVFLLRRRGGRYELMRSVDALASFQLVYDMATFAGDAWMQRDGRTDLYVITRTGVVKSTDLGLSWVSVGPAPLGGLQTQAELTGSEAGAPRLWSVWTVAALDKLYRSDDAGATWTFVQDIGDYWNVLAASITSVDLFLYGGVETHRSVNGGTSFSVINTWGAYYANPAIRLHADIQGIDVVPNAGPFGETWYIATDGGLYRSTDLLTSVQNLALSGLRVSQYYSTHTSARSVNRIVAGAQDQGYQRANTAPTPPNTNYAFTQLISGDYGHLTSGDGDHDYLFSCYPGFVLCHVGENNPALFTEDFPAGEDHAWIPPIVADPLDPRHFFLCASRIYRYTKAAGNNWTPALWSTFDFGVAAGEYVSALVFSLDPQRAYAVTDRGRLYYSSNRGVSWTPSTSTGPSGQYFYGTALHASFTDVNTVYVGGSGYSGPAIYRSTDGGVSFQPYSTGLPPTLVYCLSESPDNRGTMFCGTETSAYARDPGAPSWIDITSTQAPITIYWSVEAVPGNVMRFGTYGRGIWDYRNGERTRVKSKNL